MQYRIDPRAIATEYFGYSKIRRFQLPGEPSPDNLSSSFAPASADMESVNTNLLGLPVFSQVIFKSVADVPYEGVVLHDPIIEVNLPLNIVTTSIPGRKGLVKEFISPGDYAVTIKGVLASDPHTDERFKFPLDEMKQLKQVAESGYSMPIAGVLLQRFGIKNLVITNIKWNALPGFINLQAYEIQALSDIPIEIGLQDAI